MVSFAALAIAAPHARSRSARRDVQRCADRRCRLGHRAGGRALGRLREAARAPLVGRRARRGSAGVAGAVHRLRGVPGAQWVPFSEVLDRGAPRADRELQRGGVDRRVRWLRSACSRCGAAPIRSIRAYLGLSRDWSGGSAAASRSARRARLKRAGMRASHTAAAVIALVAFRWVVGRRLLAP